MTFRTITFLFLLGIHLVAQAPAPNPIPGDPGEETPAARRSIPLKLGSVDTVQGELSLRMPLGPRLPGRVPLGFTWAFDAHNSLHTYVGGDFRPVVWPSSSTKRISFTVLVNGEAWSFPSNYIVTNFNVPTIMQQRGIDDGLAEAVAAVAANNANINNVAVMVGPLESEVYTTRDEGRYFVRTHWKLVNATNPSAYSNWYEGKRMFLIDGNNTIWTNGKGVNHFTTAWGDHITSTESGLTSADPYPDQLAGGTILIKNENHPEQTLTLTLKLDHLDVTNTLGLPNVHLPGHWNYTRRSTREVLMVPETIYDVGFIPTAMELQAQGDTSTKVTTAFEWTPGGLGGVFPPLKSVTHPNGLKESFTYGTAPIKRTADYAFDPETGNWVGFRPQSNLMWGSFQYLPVVKVAKVDVDGKGSSVNILRESPDWTEAAQSTWLETKHTTTLQTYATPDWTGAYRQVKLTHPSFEGSGVPDGIWGNPSRATESEAQAAYLFATGAVVQTDLYDEAGAIYKTAAFNGWDLHSKHNPQGLILSGGQAITIPILATPTGTTIWGPNLPVQTSVLQNWQDVAFTTRHAGNTPPAGGAAGGWTWGASSVSPSTALDQTTSTTLGYLSNNTWQPQTVTKALSGDQLASLRTGAGSNLALETVSYTYDAMTRVSGVTTKLGTGITQEARLYAGTNPQPTDVYQWAGFGANVTSAVPLNYAGMVGKTYTYSAAPDYFTLGEIDKLTGVGTTYERDALGRVTKTTDPNGVITTTSYDAWGRVEYEIRLAAGGIGAVSKHHTYDPNGTWTRIDTTAEGKTLRTEERYDGFGHTIQEVAADGGTRTTTYNGYGEMTTQSPWLKPGQTPYGNATFTYDGKGRLVTAKDPQGRTLSSTPLDPAWNSTAGGIATTVIDDRGYSRTTVTDLLAQKKSLTDPKGQVTTFTYDAYGHMASMSLSGQTRTYQYDDLGHMVARNEPEEGLTQYSGFTMWGVPGRTTPKGITGTENVILDTVFDSMGRSSQIFDHAPGTFVRSLHYDPRFPTRVTAVEESQADGYMREDYAYDALGRMTGKAIVDDQLRSFSMTQTLDAMGNVTVLTYPGPNGGQGSTLQIGYDPFFRPSTLTKDGQTRAIMAYDQVAGTQVSNNLTFGNAATTLRTFDKGELSLIRHSSTGNVDANPMSWTAGGLLLSRSSDTFTYDELGRLKSASTTGLSGEVHSQIFTYDAWGNRTQNQVSTTGAGVTPDESLNWTATYATDNHLPANVYDPQGSALPTGASYDAFGRLTRVWAIPGQVSSLTSWIYDASGRTTMENGVRFLLDAQGLRFRRTKPDGNVQYTVYGFNRDPLSTFEATAPTPVQALVTKSSGTKFSAKKQASPTFMGEYGKLKKVHTEVKTPRMFTKPLPQPSSPKGPQKKSPAIAQRKVVERPEN